MKQAVGSDKPFTPNKPGQFAFPMVSKRSHSMANNKAFIMCSKSSQSESSHSDRFGVFLFLYTIFQAFKT